jgi:chromosome segregation ATPase
MRVLLLCAAALAAKSDAGLNPVTRVAQLLEGLAMKVKGDGEAEQELYDKYKCWCTKVINSKTASIASNAARIEELTTYIDDLSSGKIELTSERTDLEAEIKQLEKTIEEETTLRDKENEDYVAAKEEMDKAITALESAVGTLEAVQVNGTSLSSMSSELKRIAKFGSSFLAKRDVDGLMKALQNQVPEVDYEQLKKDPTFKQKYGSRSGSILDILKDMTSTFKDNRDSATEAEEKAVENFDALMGSKNEQLSATKQALLDKSKEKGARSESLATSNEEKEDREEQNERDEVFLHDTKDACDKKATDWDLRKKMRAEEIAAIGEAISILRSDDARDTFKKSFESQDKAAEFFLQTHSTKKHHHTRRSLALSAIRKVARKSKDARLDLLVTMLAESKDPLAEAMNADPFAAVIESIDQMLEDLRKEEAEDLSQKEYCEKERMEKTQTAKMTSKEIDLNSDTIDRLTSEIAAANKSIEEIVEQVTELKAEVKDAKEQREKETPRYLADKADDSKAITLIETAVDALEKYYGFLQTPTDFLQKKAEVRRVRQPFVEAGEAPTPPPDTWEADSYKKAEGESEGILNILSLIKADIEKDIEKADAEEAAAQAAFETFEGEVNESITKLEATKSDLEGEISSKEEAMVTEKTERSTNQENLDTTLSFLREIAPGCDFIAVNFDTRMTNRQLEVDGLNQAKSVIQGADFGL